MMCSPAEWAAAVVAAGAAGVAGGVVAAAVVLVAAADMAVGGGPAAVTAAVGDPAAERPCLAQRPRHVPLRRLKGETLMVPMAER
jgi:hypothetical protein